MKKFFILQCSVVLAAITATAAEMPRICNNCGSRNSIVPIVYGMPSNKMLQEEKDGEIICGGCIIRPEKYGCTECKFLYAHQKTVPPALRIIILGREYQDLCDIPADTEITTVNGKFYERIAELSVSKVKNAEYCPPQDPAIFGTAALPPTPPAIIVTLLPADTVKWHKLTEKHAGRQTAVYAMGHYMFSPVIMEKITSSSFRITADNTPLLPKIAKWLKFRSQQ